MNYLKWMKNRMLSAISVLFEWSTNASLPWCQESLEQNPSSTLKNELNGWEVGNPAAFALVVDLQLFRIVPRNIPRLLLISIMRFVLG